MCGRFSLITNIEEIIERFEIENPKGLSFIPGYNIAPGQNILAVINDGKENRAGFLKWGLVPSWAKDTSIGYKMINARSETLHKKPSFKNLLTRRRCLIIADSFYEWKKINNEKQPVRIMMKSKEPFAFAGLWDKWQKDDEMLTTCTIITMKPNKLMKDIHNRMPVILTREQEKIWLDRTLQRSETLKDLFEVPYNEDKMHTYPVSQVVNSAKNNSPKCIQPLAT